MGIEENYEGFVAITKRKFFYDDVGDSETCSEWEVLSQVNPGTHEDPTKEEDEAPF